MGFSWFWNRVSNKWIVSGQAACMFGLAAMLICLLTAYWLGAITIHEASGAASVAWGVLGVFGVLSVPFLWGGMRKYQELQDPGEKSKALRLAMMIGVWYTAIIYYLLVYLPARGRGLKSGDIN